MKVIDVLDQLFCQHIKRDRYSSTIYPTVKSIIDQLEWTYELVYLEDVYDNIIGAIDNLKSLQDSVYSNYGESSLLEGYTDNVAYGAPSYTVNGGLDSYTYPPGLYTDYIYGNQEAYHFSGKNYAASKLDTLKQQLHNLVKESTTFKAQHGFYSQHQDSYAYPTTNTQQSQSSSPAYTTHEATPYIPSSSPASYNTPTSYSPHQSYGNEENQQPYVTSPVASYDEQHVNYNQRAAGSDAETDADSTDTNQEEGKKMSLDVVQEDRNEDSENRVSFAITKL